MLENVECHYIERYLGGYLSVIILLMIVLSPFFFSDCCTFCFNCLLLFKNLKFMWFSSFTLLDDILFQPGHLIKSLTLKMGHFYRYLGVQYSLSNVPRTRCVLSIYRKSSWWNLPIHLFHSVSVTSRIFMFAHLYLVFLSMTVFFSIALLSLLFNSINYSYLKSSLYISNLTFSRCLFCF